ncbi:hypothetical protein CRUP_019168 [Coryphaenoides rupestris]|nr:hypothetical protein CRUP_019168 [Coryphaenoides rupestris]
MVVKQLNQSKKNSLHKISLRTDTLPSASPESGAAHLLSPSEPAAQLLRQLLHQVLRQALRPDPAGAVLVTRGEHFLEFP